MALLREDGSVQSANIPDSRFSAKDRIDRDFGIYRCMITRVFFVDDPANLTFTNKQVTYEAMILGGALEGQLFQNVKSMADYGGEYNYSEKIWRPNDVPLTENPLSNLTGDIVYVALLQGRKSAPVIIGGGANVQDIENTGATKADGFRSIKQYNGVFEGIDKNGIFTHQLYGGSLDPNSGVLVPGETPQISAVLDPTAKTHTTTVGKATVTINGIANTMTIVIGSVTFLIDGNSGKISLLSGFIDLGSSVSDFVTMFSQLASAFNGHTHIWPGGVVPAPTSPPIAPLLTSVGSQTVRVQA